MKTLKLKDGTFLLDGIDIGDYLEAEFIECHGTVSWCRGVRGDQVPVIGYKLRLTLSANVTPEMVLYATSLQVTQRRLVRSHVGEKLVLAARRVKNRYIVGIK